jgi:transposase-like protein
LKPFSISVIWQKKSCWGCGSFHVIKWGKQGNKQRFKCKDCNLIFQWANTTVRDKNRFVWFIKWIMERQVYRFLVRDSSMSESSLQRLFKRFLSKAPTVVVKPKHKTHLLIDGSYFAGGLCLILYYDHDIRYVQLYRHSDEEKFKEIYEDLKNLQALGVEVYSITCDGHKAILKAIKKAYPNVIVQRCVVHIKRQVKNYLSTSPKTLPGISLLRLSRQITRIKTQEECGLWLLAFKTWCDENEVYINQQSYNVDSKRYWYPHKNLHAAYTLILKAIPNMFHYLNDEQIPATTNRLENYFGHLKEKLTLHRGLKMQAKRNFIKWYLYFKNNPE